MLGVNAPIGALGPVLDVHVGVSSPRRRMLEAASLAVPPNQPCRLLIDTGASCTCVDKWVIQSLALTPSGSTEVHTPSTGAGNPHSCNQYDVSLIIPHSELSRIFHAIPVIESEFSHQGIDGLLGRDVLNRCLFIYNGELGVYTLAF
jgi:hypothetical protein